MFWLWVLLALAAAGVAGYFSWRADVRRAVPHPWIPAVLRTLVIFLTALLLLAPTFTIRKNETKKPVILVLQDNSRSVANELGSSNTAYQTQLEDLIDKFSSDYEVVKWNLEGQTDSLYNFNKDVTDIASSIDRVQEFYGTQNLGAVILATDGRYNQGINPIYRQSDMKGPLYTIGIGDTIAQKDIRISKVYANKTATLNNSFEIRADILADKCAGYNNTIRVLENDNVLSGSTLNISSDRYDRSVSFTVKADRPGLHHYIISVPPAEGEEVTANNRRDVFVEVVDQQKHILIAGVAPHPDIKAITEALKGLTNYKITVRVNNDFPSLLEDYDILILHQLPGTGYRSNPTITRAKKPTLYILGMQTDKIALNQMQKPVSFNINPPTPHDIFAEYNNGFNAFNLPQDIRSVADRWPPLSVPQGTLQLYPDAQALFTGKGNNMPLWALQQGTIPTAIITGEGLWRWRMYEYKNFNNTNVTDECIRQTIAFLSTDNTKDPFRVTLPKYIWSDREAITFNAFLRNANNEAVNTPEATIIIKDSTGNTDKYSFERSGSTYRLNIGIRAGGTYTYSASVKYNGKTYTSSGSFVVETIPLELMETGADYNMLYTLAQKNNGAFFPASQMQYVYDSVKTNKNIKPVIETTIESIPLIDRKWFFFLILLFAVAEWLIRKYWLAQ